MGVPTVTTISPSTGRSMGGFVVRVVGTNFRVLTDEYVPESTGGIVRGDWAESVKVQVDGVAAESVEVLSATQIQFIMPMYADDPKSLPKQATIRIANLNSDGDEISGEVVTKTKAFTYVQKDLTSPCHLLGLVGLVILLIRRAVIQNVSLTTDIDWNDIDEDQRKTHEASIPAIYLRGPQIIDPKSDQSVTEDEVTFDDNQNYRIDQDPTVANVRFQVMGVSDNSMECINLGQAFLEWVKNQATIRVPRDPADESKGYRDYEFGFILNGQPSYKKVASLFQFIATIEVERVLLTSEEYHTIEKGMMITAGTDTEWLFGYPAGWITFERKN